MMSEQQQGGFAAIMQEQNMFTLLGEGLFKAYPERFASVRALYWDYVAVWGLFVEAKNDDSASAEAVEQAEQDHERAFTVFADEARRVIHSMG